MASADYYLCDVCGGKAFYDADRYEQFHGLSMSIACEDCTKEGYKTAVISPAVASVIARADELGDVVFAEPYGAEDPL